MIFILHDRSGCRMSVPAPHACSFSPDTSVLMADGTAKPIDAVVIGDKVEAADPLAMEASGKLVTALHADSDARLADVIVDVGNGVKATVHTTRNHRFWNASTYKWTRADSLRAGDLLKSSGGRFGRVVAVKLPPRQQRMLNLTVADFHTYYVLAGGVPVLVHNECVTIYKAPARGMTDSLMNHGFDPADFPGSGNGFPDGKAYFGLHDVGKEIALDYASRGGYDNAVISIRIPKDDRGKGGGSIPVGGDP
jgi:Pretoxin HINT domain